jgi:hypothetical protein
MNPKERQEFENMKKELANIRQASDIVFSESLKKRILDDYIESGVTDNATTGENATTVVPPTGGNVLHAKQYDKRVRVQIGASTYYIGLYEI